MILWVLNSLGLFSARCQAGREPLSLQTEIFIVFVTGLHYCRDTLSCGSSEIPRASSAEQLHSHLSPPCPDALGCPSACAHPCCTLSGFCQPISPTCWSRSEQQPCPALSHTDCSLQFRVSWVFANMNLKCLDVTYCTLCQYSVLGNSRLQIKHLQCATDIILLHSNRSLEFDKVPGQNLPTFISLQSLILKIQQLFLKPNPKWIPVYLFV